MRMMMPLAVVEFVCMFATDADIVLVVLVVWLLLWVWMLLLLCIQRPPT